MYGNTRSRQLLNSTFMVKNSSLFTYSPTTPTRSRSIRCVATRIF